MTTSRHFLIWSQIALLSLLLGGPRGFYAGAAPSAYKSLHRPIIWGLEGSNKEVIGLYMTLIGDEKLVTRILAQTPSDGRIRITQILDGTSGIETTELLDDRTGWTATMTVDFGIQAKSLNEFFHRASEVLTPEVDQAGELTLTTSSGTRFHQRVPVNGFRSQIFQSFGRALREAAVVKQITSEIPKSLVIPLGFLDLWLSPDQLDFESSFGYSSRSIVEVLAMMLPKSETDAEDVDDRWIMTFGQISTGIGLTDPAQLELASQFHSVENADPLADLRHRHRGLPSGID